MDESCNPIILVLIIPLFQAKALSSLTYLVIVNKELFIVIIVLLIVIIIVIIIIIIVIFIIIVLIIIINAIIFIVLLKSTLIFNDPLPITQDYVQVNIEEEPLMIIS